MSSTDNKTSIIKGWIKKYYKTRWIGFAQWVENSTGDYPDDPLYVSENEKPERTEDDMILEALKNNQHIF